MSLTGSSRWAAPLLANQKALGLEASVLLAALHRHAPADAAEHGEPPVGQPITLEEAHQVCREVTRVHSRSFYFSSQLLPPDKRRSVRALYAFCRTSDDLVDRSPGNAAAALARWVKLVHAPEPPPDNPVLLAWTDAVRQHQIPSALVDELLAGLAMDLSVTRYETYDDLWLYCYRVASVVGLISMHIVGYEVGAPEFAVQLGVALQLTNILRDVGEDARRGRVYLPLEDLSRFGLCADDILNTRYDERFRALLRFEIARAEQLYDLAWPGIALLSRDSRTAIGAAAEVYRAILGRIVANDYDVFTRRAYVPLPAKLLVLGRVWRRVQSM